MEERRGESIDVTMERAGKEIEAARAAAQGECDAEGIDPTWNNAERCTRLIDIQQGSPLMQEERQRKKAYAAKISNESLNDETITILQGIAVNENTMKLLIDESMNDKFLGDIASTKKRSDFRVLYVNDEPVGFAIPRKDSDGRYRTGAIFVLPQYRNKGYASQFTETYFKDRSGRAFIEPSNSNSSKLFASTGFKKTGKQIKDSEGVIYNEWLKG